MPHKSFLSISLLALVAMINPLHAEYLCDPACKVTASFPNGGSIDAVEEVSFLFGDSGLIDTGTTSTAYVKGETLTLNAGESLVFGKDGSFTLGDQGNIDYQQLVFDTDGRVNIASGAEHTSVTIDPQRLSLKGGGTLLVKAEQLTLIEETQEPNSDSSSSPTPPCTIDNSSGATLTISSGVTSELDSSTICTEQNVDLQLNETDPTLTGGSSQVTTLSLDTAKAIPIEKESSGTIDWYLLGVFGALLLANTRSKKRARLPPSGFDQ